MPGTKVGPDDSFVSLAGDSLSYIQVSMAIEDRLGELPADWERLTVSRLDALAAASGRTAPSATRSLSSDILVRLGAIAAILVSHLHIEAQPFSLVGGALTLMIVAGLTLNMFQRDLLLSPHRMKLIELFALRYLLPYYVVLLVFHTFGNGSISAGRICCCSTISCHGRMGRTISCGSSKRCSS